MNHYHLDPFTQIVSEALFYLWDPIGIRLNADMRDEYEDYVPKVLLAAIEMNDVDQLADYLEGISGKYIGIERHRETHLNTARFIIEAMREMNNIIE